MAMRFIAAFLAGAILTACASPVPAQPTETCEFFLSEEKIAWKQMGFKMTEIHEAQAFLGAMGLTAPDVDLIVVLSKEGAPNVVVILVSGSCILGYTAVPVDALHSMLSRMGA